MVDELSAEGWADVIVMDQGAWFATWDHHSASLEDEGKVFITCTSQGEVTVHKGYITNAEAKRREKADSKGEAAPKPELTKAAQNYVDLHRHAAVRNDLLNHSGTALRLISAHMIAGSSLWHVEADPQKAAKPESAESLEQNTAQQRMVQERADIAAMLGVKDNTDLMASRDSWSRPCIKKVFATLQTLSDEQVTRILTFLMADSLSVHSPLINELGAIMETDMRHHWTAMVGEFAGKSAARENITATAKTHRAILNACLDGTRTPAKPDWMPVYMAFPQGSYREQAVEPVEATDLPEDEQAKAA